MGLLCGSRVFRKGGLFHILQDASVIFPTESDLESRRPIFYAFDAMCKLTRLRGLGAPIVEAPNIINRWFLPGFEPPAKKHKEDPTKKCLHTYKPSQIAEALFLPLEVFVACHPHANVTIGLMCDVRDEVPKEKHALQELRTRQSAVSPYDVDGRPTCITNEGLIIGEDHPISIDMCALMATRSIRPQLYRYLRDWIMNHKWRNSFTLIFDADFPDIGHHAFSFEIHPNQVPIETTVVHSGTGEGEISALVWALRHRETHSVQLHSGDLDLLALMILHGHKFTFPVRAVLCEKHVANYSDIVQILESQQFSKDDLILGSIMLGTDFVSKKELTHRCNPRAVFDAVRTWRLLDPDANMLERIQKCDREYVSKVMTIANSIRKKDKCLEMTNVTIHAQIMQQLHQQKSATNQVEITENGVAQLLFNLQYWTNLAV
jgi:hypothetical protein